MKQPSRRSVVAALVVTPWFAQAAAPPSRELRLENLHTGERLAVEYCSAGRYNEDGLAAVNHLLRDFRTGDVGRIDPALLDLLHALHQRLNADRAFQVISGYRSPGTNAALRRRSNGVAERSLHMDGRAIDIRLSGVRLSDLRAAAIGLRQGGVGFYPSSNFVHIDVGRVRTW